MAEQLQSVEVSSLVTPCLVENPIPAFAATIAGLIERHPGNELALCVAVGKALTDLVRDAAWIPQDLRGPNAGTYRRERLYEAPGGSFSIGCFVWGPGQRTPIHDHRSWGVFGVAQGSIDSLTFFPTENGRLVPVSLETIGAGTCAWVHPEGGDIHRIGSAGGETATSIHVYGCRFDRVRWRAYEPDGTVRTP